MVRTATKTRMRLHAALVLLTAVFAFLSASLRAPTLGIQYAAIASAVVRDDSAKGPGLDVASAELGRIPVARSVRGDVPSAPRADRALGAVATAGGLPRLPRLASRFAEAPALTSAGWTNPAKTHAELMVFLN